VTTRDVETRCPSEYESSFTLLCMCRARNCRRCPAMEPASRRSPCITPPTWCRHRFSRPSADGLYPVRKAFGVGRPRCQDSGRRGHIQGVLVCRFRSASTRREYPSRRDIVFLAQLGCISSPSHPPPRSLVLWCFRHTPQPKAPPGGLVVDLPFSSRYVPACSNNVRSVSPLIRVYVDTCLLPRWLKHLHLSISYSKCRRGATGKSPIFLPMVAFENLAKLCTAALHSDQLLVCVSGNWK